MKFLFDQIISHMILKILPEIFQNCTTVKKQGLINASDREIWDFAKSNEYIIFTQDSDFNDLSALYGFPPKIIWFRTGNLKTLSIVNILIDNYDDIKKFKNDSNFGCFEIFKLK